MSGQQESGADPTGQGEPDGRGRARQELNGQRAAGCDPGPAAPRLPVRDPGASQVRALAEHIRALDDLEILRRVLAALRGL